MDVKYSAESMIALMDEAVTEFSTYDNPDQIRSMILAINMEHMKEEDIQTVINHYNYSLEELGVFYEEAMHEHYFLSVCSSHYADMSMGIMPEEVKPENRFFVIKYLLDKDNELFESVFYVLDYSSCTISNGKTIYERVGEKTGMTMFRDQHFYDDIFYDDERDIEALDLTERIICDVQAGWGLKEYNCLNPYTNTEFSNDSDKKSERWEIFFKNHPIRYE